jgi:quercetin 2,3-dioxygenase
MFTIRKADDRGRTNIGWLNARHTFSFGEYFDPAHHHYRSLRVINDDRVAAGAGFPTHPHRDMEILTHILQGELEHADSMGTGSVIRAGEWQYMSAGSGVTHSEFNPSHTQPVHLLQIWLMPDKKGYPPRYEQKAFAHEPGQWVLVASPDGRDGSIQIRQDAQLWSAQLQNEQVLTYQAGANRGVWLHVATGQCVVNGHRFGAGDSAAIENEKVTIVGTGSAEVILFDLGS